MRFAAQITIAGLVGLLALKLLGLLIAPTVALMSGLFGLVLKIAFVILVGFCVMVLFRKLVGVSNGGI